MRVNEIEIQTSETIETLKKKERDQSELCAKLQENRAIARERDDWKKKYEDLQVAYKEDEIKHLKELYMAKVEPNVAGGSVDNEILGGIQRHTPQDESTGAVCIERARGSSADTTVCF